MTVRSLWRKFGDRILFLDVLSTHKPATFDHRDVGREQGELTLLTLPVFGQNVVTTSRTFLAMPKRLSVRRNRIDEFQSIRSSQAGHIVPSRLRIQRVVCAEGQDEPADALIIENGAHEWLRSFRQYELVRAFVVSSVADRDGSTGVKG